MIGRCLCIMSVILFAAGDLFADERQNDPLASNSPAVTRDIVYFYSKHPIFIRMRIEIDEASFERSWIEYVQSLFTELDSDGDGRLRPEEVIAQSNTTGGGPSPEAMRLARDPEFWSADRNPFDQTITMDELTTFLVANDRGPFQTADAENAPVSKDTVGTTLFGLLDLDADRNLSSEELAAAMTSLHRRDLDDDGIFGISELGPSPNPYVALPVSMSAEAAQPFIALTSGSAPIAVVRELERRYAPTPSVMSGSRTTLSRDLGRKDLGLEAESFNQYDFDADGKLDRDELRGLIRNPPPTLELVVRLGTRAEGDFVVDLLGSANGPNIAVRRSADGLASIVINDVQIEIAETANGPDVPKQRLLEQFRAADLDRNNYLEEGEVGRSSALMAVFSEFDEDGDGKLFENELTAVVDGRMKAAQSRTRMDVSNRGRNLFEILDVDRNRSLGRRELAQAVRRIVLWDTDGDGAVSEAEIPQLYQISFGPGLPEFRGLRIPGDAERSREESNSTLSVAPKWFEKLDRNGDGELTRREFPGTIGEFQQLDQNSDGVVDTVEASIVK